MSQIFLAMRIVQRPDTPPFMEIYDTVSNRTVYGVLSAQCTQSAGDMSGPKMQIEVLIAQIGNQAAPTPDAERSRVIDLDGQGVSQ